MDQKPQTKSWKALSGFACVPLSQNTCAGYRRPPARRNPEPPMTDVGFRDADVRPGLLFAHPEARKSNCRPYENCHEYRASNSECDNPQCPIRRQSALRVVQVNEKHVHRQAKYQIEECNMSGQGAACPNQKTIALQFIHSLVPQNLSSIDGSRPKPDSHQRLVLGGQRASRKMRQLS
jgi:hypothetical protein